MQNTKKYYLLPATIRLYFLLLMLCLSWSKPSWSAQNPQEEGVLKEYQERILAKQARMDDLTYQIKDIGTRIDRERKELQASNERIWKEFNGSLEIERKELKEKIESVDEKRMLFEKELEKKREQDLLRIRERELAMKKILSDLERLRLEIEEDKKSFEALRQSYAVTRQNVEKKEPAIQITQREGTDQTTVKVARVRGRDAMGNSPARMADVRQEYYLEVGDILGIDVWRVPDLTRRVTVRPDGRISLPLAGDISVQGTTLTELREVVTQKFSEYIRNPQVSISLEGFGGRKFIILGQVRSPGVYRYQNAISLLEAIALAGGFQEEARRGKIMIIRGDIQKTPQVKVITANIANILKYGMISENMTILPNDIVYVGRDFLGDYKDVIEEIVEPALDNAIDFFVLRSAIRTAQQRATGVDQN